MPILDVVELTEYDPDIGPAFDALRTALKREGEWTHDEERMRDLIEGDRTSFFIGYWGGLAVASTTLVRPYPTMEARIAEIEDVAVLPDARGHRFADQMLDRAEGEGWDMGADRIKLSSHPDFRPEANRIYLERGYRIHDTNLFILDCPD